FFQAEDGIRDRNVTGVQTFALPIWCCFLISMLTTPAIVGRKTDYSLIYTLNEFARTNSINMPLIVIIGISILKSGLKLIRIRHRSEERRVGKECRKKSYKHYNKKKE